MFLQSLSGKWNFRQFETSEWLPATVPGGVHTDLLALGKIPDPFAGDNEKAVQWIAEVDWEYRSTFTADPKLMTEQQVMLVCDGLDTLADVYLNGEYLGHADNMFRSWEFEVKNLLQPGENQLLIHFGAPVAFIRGNQAQLPLQGGGDIQGGPHLRKAPCHWGWDWGWNKPNDPVNQHLKAGYDRMFHHMLPEIVEDEDPDTEYWPSSASSNTAFEKPNEQEQGDCHYWAVWHGRRPFTAYRSQFPRFMSEFGFQALPPYKTIQTYAGPADQNMTSYIMEHHQRSGSGNGLMIAQMTNTFRMPKNFESLVYLSLLLQAEGIRYGVEHWRRNRQRVSGTLIWQLNDCWPVASWASLDYYGRWKALHYAAKRFYAPLLLSVEDNGPKMEVHLTSDLLEPVDVFVHWHLESVTGEVLKSGEKMVRTAVLQDTLVGVYDFTAEVMDGSTLSASARRLIFLCEFSSEVHSLAGHQLTTFVPNKHLELQEPGLLSNVSEKDGLLTIGVRASSLARFVELSFEGADVVFSDNFFDVPAGISVYVTAPLPVGWTEAQARTALRVCSLIDSYQ